MDQVPPDSCCSGGAKWLPLRIVMWLFVEAVVFATMARGASLHCANVARVARPLDPCSFVCWIALTSVDGKGPAVLGMDGEARLTFCTSVSKKFSVGTGMSQTPSRSRSVT
eukprot:3784246-Amphidinium_carterae.1